MGTGVETSSHKHGLFQHTCVSYDMLLPNGDIVHCSKVLLLTVIQFLFWSPSKLFNFDKILGRESRLIFCYSVVLWYIRVPACS